MRVVGIHKSGIKVVIIKNESKKYDLYCYCENGALIKEDEFKSLENAKNYVRSKYRLKGKWKWDIRLKLRASPFIT